MYPCSREVANIAWNIIFLVWFSFFVYYGDWYIHKYWDFIEETDQSFSPDLVIWTSKIG
jgi:hypothetical protein